MFAVDRRILTRLEPTIRRVLIVDPNTHAARLIVDIVKGLGARDVAVETNETAAMLSARDLEPGLVFLERSGNGLDGEALTRSIRRSHMSCRRSPIIMVTAEATATSIKGARDAGVHEFLRKPFTSADLFKRIENVALKPRDWVEGVAYVGPDRRRFNSGEFTGAGKRQGDRPASPAAANAQMRDQAMRILAAALNQFDNDPMQAARAIREQSQILKALALKTSDARLAAAVGALELTISGGAMDKASLAAPISQLLAMHQPMERPATPQRAAG